MQSDHDIQRFAPSVRAEQIRALFRHHPLSLIGTTVVAVMAWFVLVYEVDNNSLNAWALAVAAVVLARAILWLRFESEDRTVQSVYAWGKAAVALSFTSGVIFAALPLMFIRGEEPFTMINIVILSVGMLAGSLISQSVYLPAYLAFSLPLAVALSASVHIFGGEHRELAYLGYVFSLVIIGFARNSNRVFRASIETRFENLRLIEELRDQKAEAEAANHAKSQFLAAASHDLRQPLHSLGLYAGALSDAASTHKQVELTGKMALAIKALEQLFQHILEISKLDAGVVSADVSDLRLADVLSRLELRYHAIAEQQGLNFACHDGDHVVLSDALLLERILDNLLANAFRYTEKGGVTLAVSSHGRIVTLSIRDTGRGIPPEEHDNIFREFYQLDNPERDRQKGLGLGLSIVRRLCQLLGHELTFESVPGQGTEFRVSLPRGKAERLARATAEEASFDWELTNAHILVIDDEEEVRNAMKAQLESWGCRVQTADGIDQALGRDVVEPQLIIADYRLRNHTSGISAVFEVRDHFDREIPAVLMTGDTAVERLVQAEHSGLKVVHKPVSPGKLRVLVNRLARSRS